MAKYLFWVIWKTYVSLTHCFGVYQEEAESKNIYFVTSVDSKIIPDCLTNVWK